MNKIKKLVSDCIYDIGLRIKTSYEMEPEKTLVGVLIVVLLIILAV